jgi:hypothetical protein
MNTLAAGVTTSSLCLHEPHRIRTPVSELSAGTRDQQWVGITGLLTFPDGRAIIDTEQDP